MRSARSAAAIGAVCLGALALLLAGPPGRAAAGGEDAARPLLWECRGEPHLWILGTCDLPDARAQNLPPAAEKALKACGAFVTELPASAEDATRLEAQVKRLSGLDPAAGGLRNVLGDQVYERALAYLPEITTLESREPWYVQRLVVKAHRAAAVRSPVPLLTQALWDRASGDGLETAGLDTVPEYLEAFDGLDVKDQAAWFGHVLELYDKEKEAKVKREERLVKTFVAGDAEQAQAIWREILPADELGAKLVATMLDQRVRRMLGRLTSRLERKPDTAVFLAVDAAWLVGEHGVLAQLAAAGRAPRRVP